jgi:hypothetical protein
MGCLAFGTADQPRDQQIAAGVQYFTKAREHQRQLKHAIEELKNLGRGTAKDRKPAA